MKKRVSLQRMLNKKTKRIPALLAVIMTVALLCSIAPVSAAEQTGEDYTYTVRILGGAQGKVTGGAASRNGITPTVSGSDLIYTNLKKNDSISFDVSNVAVNNPDKYRATEIRLSGRDNQDLAARLQTFTVTEDRDCVVAYNVKSANDIAYTIYYRDAAGNDIPGLSPVTLYGNRGETMVVGAKWSDNYFPNTYNREIEFGNGDSYTFVYQPNPTPTPAPTPTPTPAPVQPAAPVTTTTTTVITAPPVTTTTTVPGIAGTGTGTAGTGTTGTGTAGTGAEEAAGTGTTAAGNAEAAGTGTTPQADTAGTGAGTAEAGAEGAAQNANPQGAAGETVLPASPDEVPEILNINDEEVPLAAPGDGNETSEGIHAAGEGNTTESAAEAAPASGLTKAMKVGIGAAAAAIVLIAVLIVFFKKRR